MTLTLGPISARRWCRLLMARQGFSWIQFSVLIFTEAQKGEGFVREGVLCQFFIFPLGVQSQASRTRH